MAKYTINDTTLTSIADAIRAKGGTSAALTPAQMADAIAAIQAGGGGNGRLWGGKYTTGSFVLAQEMTSEYVIASGSDDAITGLLEEGEKFSNVYTSTALLVVRKPTAELAKTDYPKCSVLSMHVPSKYGGESSSDSCTLYWDAYGSLRAVTGATKGAEVEYNRLVMNFTTSYMGSPDFEYRWLAWRHLI